MRLKWYIPVLVLALGACALPRGAALNREVLAGSEQSDSAFSVVPVTRASLPEIADWPATGWSGNYRWLQSGGGPGSAYIKPGDIIDLVVWDNQDTSLLTGPGQNLANIPGNEVSPAGTIFVPYVGEVRVSGMTQAQARLEVQDAVSMISQSAQVQLTVTAGQGNTVDMVSGVVSPGPIALDSRSVSLLSAIAQSGGIDPDLKNPLVQLTRGNKTYQIRAADLFADARRNITLRGGDKIIVKEDDRYFVALGATGSEALIYFDRETITALEALSMAGGLADNRANLKGVLILREYPENAVSANAAAGPDRRQVIFTFDLTTAEGLFAARKFRVNPRDTVIATESVIGPASTVLSFVARLLDIRASL